MVDMDKVMAAMNTGDASKISAGIPNLLGGFIILVA